MKNLNSLSIRDIVLHVIVSCYENIYNKTSVEIDINGLETHMSKELRTFFNWNSIVIAPNHEDTSNKIYKHDITKDNISSILKLRDVPEGFEFLSVRQMFNDFYILEEILKNYNIDVVTCVYNGTIPPDEDKVVIYHRKNPSDLTTYFSASLLAFYRMMTKYDYSLVCTDRMGINAFFIKNDVIKQRNLEFENVSNVNALYTPLKTMVFWDGVEYIGRVPDKKTRDFITSEEVMTKIYDTSYESNILSLKQIIIDGTFVLIDVFLSIKYNSLVFLFNNRKEILSKTNIDTNKVQIKINNVLTPLEGIKMRDIVQPEGSNYYRQRFPEEFCITIGYIPNITDPNINVQITLNNGVKDLIYYMQISDRITTFYDKKCLTTIHMNEYHLLPSWIDFHKKIGFEKFIIYDNNFNRYNVNHLLHKYKDCLYIIDANWPYWCFADYVGGNDSVGQIIQQNHCIWKYTPEFVGLTDLDEYINVKNDAVLFNKNFSVVNIPSYWFGCNFKEKYDKMNFIKKLTRRQYYNPCVQYRKNIAYSIETDLIYNHFPLSFHRDVHFASPFDCHLNHYLIMSNSHRVCNCKDFCQYNDNSINERFTE